MIVDLVKTVTADGVRLDGALHRPASSDTVNLDALICLHGVGGNFYRSVLWEQLTPTLLELGISVMWANTRGHDSVTTTAVKGRPKRLGAAYEIIDDCREDISAWVQLLVDRELPRIGLLGHSLGALKAIYAQAFQPHPATRCLIALSAPRLSYNCFNNSAQSAEFFAALSTAEQLAADDRADSLMDATFPVPMVITAGSYVDKYGRAERYNLVKFADRIACPALYTYGQLELERGGVAFAGVPEALRERVSNSSTILTIADADHSYSAAYGVLAEGISTWLGNL